MVMTAITSSSDSDGSAPAAAPSDSHSSQIEDGPKANANNLLNILGYLLSLGTSYLGSVAGWFGGISNAELSSKYQTLITPAASYFGYIWAVIFFSEGLFAVVQLLPRYRDQPIVQRGLGPMFCLACMAQSAWAITFGYQMMISAFVSVFTLMVALLTILKRQWDIVAEEEKKPSLAASLCETGVEKIQNSNTAHFPRLQYWLLRFPFSVHAGWITCATPVMLSVLLVKQQVDPAYELWTAVISLPLIFGCCMGLLLREDAGAPAYVFPGVVVYACTGICWELQAPTNDILNRHDEASVKLMGNLSGFCGACLLVVMASRFLALLARDQYTKRMKKEQTVQINGEIFPYMQA